MSSELLVRYVYTLLPSEANIVDGRAGSGRRRPIARKERRKITRIQKKARTAQPRFQVTDRTRGKRFNVTDVDQSSESTGSSAPLSTEDITPKALKSILKPVKPTISFNTQKEVSPRSPAHRISQSVRAKLAEDDAEIEALERALGIKGKKKLPKSFENDGLDDLITELSGPEDKESPQSGKRKQDEEEQWLSHKRRKALQNAAAAVDQAFVLEEDIEDSQLADDQEDAGSAPAISNDATSENSSQSREFENFDDERGSKPEHAKVRENPYVAPTTSSEATTSTVYVPPSLRKSRATDDEEHTQLRRQIQGLLNRLSEANMLGILSDLEKLYQNNPRQHVSATLKDLLLLLLSDPSPLQDTFLILHAGLIAGVYKVMGTDFGALIIQRVIEDFDKIYTMRLDGKTGGKRLVNLISLLAEMYNFQVVGSRLIYDLVRVFLEDLSELNAELLLKVIRSKQVTQAIGIMQANLKPVSGPQLRQDDPSSLKDIVLLLQPAVAKIGVDNISVRTKFMIETINNLKNNRVKTGVAASAMLSEHTIRMKKMLGSLNARNIKASEPLRIGLQDIRDTEKRGKWWLIGASYRGKETDLENDKLGEQSGSHPKPKQGVDTDYAANELFQLAKEHRMNTDIRRSIFVTIMSASDYRDAHSRLLKLRLKKAQEFEIPQVLIHCAGAELVYNPFYTLIARLFCADRKLKMAFQFSLWDIFKRMGEGTDEDDDTDEAGGLEPRAIVNLAKMYGTLVAGGGLSISVLKVSDAEVLGWTWLIHSRHSI